MTRKSFNLSIGKKILLSFSILIVIYLGMALHSYHDMNSISVIAQEAVPLSDRMTTLQDFAISVETLERDIDKYFTVNYKENQEKVEKDFDTMKSILNSLEVNADNSSIARLQEMEKILSGIQTNFDYLLDLEQNSTNSREINEKRYSIYELINSERQKHRELLLETTNKIQINVKNQNIMISDMTRDFLMLGTLILVIGILLSVITSRSISGPINKLRSATSDIGLGRFDINIPVQSNDEVGQLASAFNKMTRELQKTTFSKDYVENIFRSMFEMLVVTAPDGTIQTVNKATCDVLGYSSEELKGQPIDKLIHDEISPSEGQFFNELVKKESLFNIEKYYLAKNGSKISVLLSMSKMYDNNGNNLGVVCVANDITERKNAELEYKTILKTAMDGFYIVDLKGNILDANDSYCSLIGYTHDELINLNLKDIDVIDTEEIIAKRIAQISKLGWARFETSHKCKEGSIVRIEASVNYIGIGGGKFFVFIRDITERKKLEYTLKENEERFRSVAQAANDAIITMDGKGDIIFWNNGAHKIFGYDNEEVIGKPITILMPEIYRDGHKSGLNRFVTTGKPHVIGKTVELSGIRKNGGTFPLELSLSNWEIGRAIFFTGILRDITERRRTEEKIKKHEDHLKDMLDLHRLGNNTEKEVLNFTLEACLRSLQSEFAFVGMMSADEAVMTVRKWSNGAMKQCAVIDNPLVFHIAETGLLGEAVRQRGPIIVNDYKTNQLYKKGYPEGHVPIKSFLSIPVFSGNKIVAVAAAANKVSEYTESDVTSFTSFLNEMWGILDYQETRREIRKSLEEKEVLLREIHHRVKNNMQIVASLLNLQSQNIEDKKYKDIFIESQTRIYSMALIHEKLYQSESLAQINLKEYIDDIVSNIFESYGQKNNIKLEINIENISIKLDYAVPCGLIINELVTNSIKYAFPDGRQGIIKISAKSNDDMIQISISDTGIGIPEDLDIRNTKSLGLKLITGLAESQLQGEIILNREKGTEFQINFRQAK